MSDFNITVPGGESKRLKTGGKYCPSDIVVTAEGGSQNDNPLYYARNMNSTYDDAIFTETENLVLRFKAPPSFTASGVGGMYRTFFATKGLKVVKIITDDIALPITFVQTFRENTDIEIVDLTECARTITNMDYMCFQANSLKSIFGALDVSQCTSFTYSFFAGTLRDVEFVPNTIKADIRFNSAYLTDASIESIINGLADLTGGTAQTLTLHSTVCAKLTDEQKTAIHAKNWTLAY
jgi:hypothetical protein